MTDSPWEHRIQGWPGVAGGFVGRSQRPPGGRLMHCPRYAAALADIGLPDGPIVEAQQVHEAEVALVTERDLGSPPAPVTRIPGVDGLITELPGVALAIYVADCLAIYLHHRARPAIGLAHAGWRGLAADIPGVLLRGALRAFGGEPADLRIALSPCIGPCCFEVGEEVARVFEHISGVVDRSHPRPHVDLSGVAMAQLLAAGVWPEHIEVMPGCTRCEPERLASHRWDPERCGRNVALLALTPS